MSGGRGTAARATLALALALVGTGAPMTGDADHVSASVGVPAALHDVVLPGSELRARPADLATEVIVRIVDVRPHGSDLRYDIEFYGLAPGAYDLRDFLQRVDGTAVDDLAPLPVRIESVLPPGQVEPNRPAPADAPPLGGYRSTLWVAGIAWVVGLVLILSSGRRRARREAAAPARRQTVAEKLQPLVEQAIAGSLSRDARAELELTLIAFWRRKLDLGHVSAAHVLPTLKQHPEAGPLLQHLETWLHRPTPGPEAEAIDVGALLRPYANLPADALPNAGSAASGPAVVGPTASGPAVGGPAADGLAVGGGAAPPATRRPTDPRDSG